MENEMLNLLWTLVRSIYILCAHEDISIKWYLHILCEFLAI